MVYPSLKGEAAKGGVLNTTRPQQISIDFNCLGIEAKTSFVLIINIPLFEPVTLYFDKECGKGIGFLYNAR